MPSSALRHALSLPRKARSFLSLGWADRGLAAEALVTLTIARVAIALPFRWYEGWLKSEGVEGSPDPVLVDRVRRAVALAARNAPFRAACLPQAMSAKALLSRRGARTALCLGAGRAPDGEMTLHAWLEAGEIVVVGRAGRSAVTPVARFG